MHLLPLLIRIFIKESSYLWFLANRLLPIVSVMDVIIHKGSIFSWKELPV
jgi:hypothetical protein